MPKISKIFAREIIDSRADPTIETTVYLDDGNWGRAGVPSGASIGQYESHELRDTDNKRYRGKGVLRAVSHVNDIIGPGLINVDPLRQIEIDRWMISVDKTPTKARVGANAMLSISMALATAAANAERVPLYQYINALYRRVGGNAEIQRIPTPIFNVINGGKHGAGNLDFQEYHVIPSTAKPYSEALRIGVELYHFTEDVLIEKNSIHSVGDEGGFAPDLNTNLDALEVVMQAVKKASYQFGEDVFLGLDVAANYFHTKGRYKIRDAQNSFKTEQFIDFLVNLNSQYHLLILEDPLVDDDWNGWKQLMVIADDSVLIVGDDLLVTNKERLQKAINEKACSGILVKPNQIGTLTESLEVVKLAQDNNFKTITSHRSGETNDTFIADFAVGVQTDYVKFGAPARGERVAKYNRLLEIEGAIVQKGEKNND